MFLVVGSRSRHTQIAFREQLISPSLRAERDFVIIFNCGRYGVLTLVHGLTMVCFLHTQYVVHYRPSVRRELWKVRPFNPCLYQYRAGVTVTEQFWRRPSE